MLPAARAGSRLVAIPSSWPTPATSRAARAALWTIRHHPRRGDEACRRLVSATPELRNTLVAETSNQHSYQPPTPNIDTGKNDIRPAKGELFAKKLPLACPGCGAPSQTVEPTEAGFYNATRPAVRAYVKGDKHREDKVFRDAISSAAADALKGLQLGTLESVATSDSSNIPICERCHQLVHHSTGLSIIHPSIKSIEDIISESPYKHNHIYHVLDAADFPMSLIPNLQHNLNLPRLRTQNRRSKSMRYIRGRVAEVSFIITRSDLLAPKKEQVDTLMPYLQDVLRDALGRTGRKVRLGNVRCVSAKRGWWTKNVKEDIWERGGAGWMVGKVNVGKSQLFESVFPKGRNQDPSVQKIKADAQKSETGGIAPMVEGLAETAGSAPSFADSPGELGETLKSTAEAKETEGYQETVLRPHPEIEDGPENDVFFDEDEQGSLLPPAQPETAYPSMPLVSSLPGTTASPIRVPFGNGKGELIDLPGIQRSNLEEYVKDEHKAELVMKLRIVPEQHTIKPTQSLLLGGLIRMTPKTNDLIFLAYPFTPLKPHITRTSKAVAISTGVDKETNEPSSLNVETIATEVAKSVMKSAGTFKLQWNVTKRRAGPLTDPVAGKQRADSLPFTVYSVDLLIEGVGWVELVAQVRKRRQSLLSDAFGQQDMDIASDQPQLPEVEVFSPEGKFVGSRRPMGAWLLGGKKDAPKHLKRARPRKSMASAKHRHGG